MQNPRNSTSIRMAVLNDARAILAIYAPYIQNSSTSFEMIVPTKEAFEKRLQKYLEEAPWIVCEVDNQIVGYAYASPHRDRAAYRWNREVSVYIEKTYQRQGIAKLLYTVLLKLLKLQGYTNALAGIVQPNPASTHFHQSLGFKLIGTYQNIGFKQGQWHDVNWYSLFLQTTDFVPIQPLTTQELMQLEAYREIFNY